MEAVVLATSAPKSSVLGQSRIHEALRDIALARPSLNAGLSLLRATRVTARRMGAGGGKRGLRNDAGSRHHPATFSGGPAYLS